MKKGNIIKKALDNIEMTNEQRFRIINACKEARRRRTPVFRGSKRLLVAAVCIVLLLATTFTVLATRRYLENTTHNTSHIPNENMSEILSVTKDGEDDGYYAVCNGVAGDSEKVYLDISIAKKDNSPILKTAEGVSVIRFAPWESVLKFEDGYTKKVYYLMLEDSTDTLYHLEAHILFYNDEKQYIGQSADLIIGNLTADLSDGSSVEICSFDDPLSVSLSVNTDMKIESFSTGEFRILNDGIEFNSAEITASKVILYGNCNIEGPLYELEEVMNNAYLICDGEEIPLGGKTDAGTMPDGRFTVSWLNATVINPQAVTAICIEGKIIHFD